MAVESIERRQNVPTAEEVKILTQELLDARRAVTEAANAVRRASHVETSAINHRNTIEAKLSKAMHALGLDVDVSDD